MKTKILFLALFTGGIHAASWPTSKMYLEVSGGVLYQVATAKQSTFCETSYTNYATCDSNGVLANNTVIAPAALGITFGGICTGSVGYDYLIPSCSNFVIGGFLGGGYSSAKNSLIGGQEIITKTQNPSAPTDGNTSKEDSLIPIYIKNSGIFFAGIRLGALMGKWFSYVKVAYIGQVSRIKLSYLQTYGNLPGNTPFLADGQSKTEEYQLKARKSSPSGVLVGIGMEAYITPSWVLGVNGEYHMFPSQSVVLKTDSGGTGVDQYGNTRYIRTRFWTNRVGVMVTLKYILPVFGNNLNRNN